MTASPPPASSPERLPDEVPLDAVHKTELVISNLLRVGVYSSLALVVTGTIITFLRHPDYLTSTTALPHVIGDTSVFPHSLHDMIQGVLELRGQSVIILGLILLISTPVLRVGVSVIAFAVQKDRLYVAITSIVFILLLISFCMGKAG